MATFTAVTVLLKTLLERVENGAIQLPDFSVDGYGTMTGSGGCSSASPGAFPSVP